MKKLQFIILVACCSVVFSFSSCNKIIKTENETKVEDIIISKQKTSELEFLKELKDKYPYNVGLFKENAFSKRVKKLIGSERYAFIIKTCIVEAPIKFENDIVVVWSCQAHNCGSTNFTVVVDLKKDVMYAGIREKDQITTYSEDGSESPEVKEWASYN